jgi:tryptophan synthase alpha chain
MSKTQNTLLANKSTGGSLIGYFPLGYPTLDESIEAAVAMCESGVDVLELGIPYSDPVMDGAVIQKATELALENGFRLADAFEAIRKITSRVEAPVLVMTYWNPVLAYGVDRFAADLAASGAAGAITPDLIPDEAANWIEATDTHNLDRVFLATPSSSESRVGNASSSSRGFVYAASTMGITGAREDLDSQAQKVVSRVRSNSPESVTAVGIGISTQQQVRQVNSYADGAIVGSAFIAAYASAGLRGLLEKVRELAKGKSSNEPA